jgi:hypothetical protein
MSPTGQDVLIGGDPFDEQFANSPTADAEPAFDEIGWWAKGAGLRDRETSTKWDIGAWLVEGANALEDQIETAKEVGGKSQPSFYVLASGVLDLAPGTLRDIASTYRRAVSVRTDACSWSHHRVLVNALKEALPKADEKTGNEWLKKWLDRAAEEKLSVVALQEAVGSGKKRKLGKTFKITVSKDIWDALVDLAYEENEDVPTLVSRKLAEYVESDDAVLERDFARNKKKERRHKQRQAHGRRIALAYDPLGLQR